MAPTSIRERNQEKGPQKVREQGCGEERDWLETGACIDWLEEEEGGGSWRGLESGLALAQALGSSCVSCRAPCVLCSSLRQIPSPGPLATAREGQTVLVSLHSPHASYPHSCVLHSSFKKEIEAHPLGKKVRHRGEREPFQKNLWIP